MKKILSLFLAVAMTITMASGAFVDQKEIGIDYVDDVNMLAQLGVVNGYEDNTFRPQDTISRVEYAKMAYVLNYGYDDKGNLFAGQKSQFNDVEGNYNVAWGKGYINYCANKGIVAGIGAGKFAPTANITVAEVSKMLLVTLGCDPVKEGFVGSNWEANVVAKAMELGVYNGWYGDPTAPATRELVCKLMRNTIFAPTYLYNPITGIGSQVSALNPSIENETLGEKVMGLKHVEGIVVSNGRYALTIDEEGEILDPMPSAHKDRTQIYYEITDSTNYVLNGEKALLNIDDVDLSDDFLGNKVDVYFRANGQVGDYGKVELIGDILVDGQTVVHEVMSKDITIMPNGESNSKREIKPYIEFKTENSIEKMVLRDELSTKRVEGNKKYNGIDFADRIFISDVAYNYDFGNLNPATEADLKELGENYIQSYRFISVDGGDTWSYVLRLNNKEVKKVSTITADTVSVSGAVAKEIGVEAEVIGNVRKGDKAVVYSKDGKLFVEATEQVTGKATRFGTKTVTINGEEYCADLDSMKVEMPIWFTSDENMGKNNNYTTYTTYKNYILDVDAEYVPGAVGDYAVVLYSTYDADMGVAKVKLAFTDGTEGVYEVSDIYGKDDEKKFHEFANNKKVGSIYQVEIRNGMADLSVREGSFVSEEGANIVDGRFALNVKNDKDEIITENYYSNDNAVIFLLYGDTNLKAKAYKMSNLDFATGAAAGVGNYASVVKSSSTSGVRSILVGAMTVGKELGLSAFGAELEDIAYVVNVEKNYNLETNEWYLEVVLISENGLLEAKTIDEVRNHKGQNIYFTDNKIGEEPDELKAGDIVSFSYADGYIQSIGALEFTNYSKDIKNGVFKVSIAAEQNDLIGFFANKELAGNENEFIVDYTLEKDEHNFKVIAIDDGNFVEDGDIEVISDGDIISADDFNAIIVVEDGKIIRIFSLYNNF